MRKILARSVLAATASGLLLTVATAGAELRPVAPVYTAVPTFACSVTVTGSAGTVVVTKSNAVAVDKTKDIVATIQTPGGKVIAATCASTFASNASGTSTKITFTNPPNNDPSFVYTCAAVQASTTLACNPAH